MRPRGQGRRAEACALALVCAGLMTWTAAARGQGDAPDTTVVTGVTAVEALPETVFVDGSAGCSPAGPGAPDSPYCTISDALSAHHAPGTVILVKPGTYPEQITVPASGLAGQPLTLLAAGTPGEPVVVAGADDFGKAGLWAPLRGDVWVARSVTWVPRQVRARGQRLLQWTGVVDDMPVNQFQYLAGTGLCVNVGGDPALAEVHVGRRRYGAYLPDRSYVRIEGFTFLESDDRGVQLNAGCTGDDVAGNTVRWAGHIGIQAIGTTDTRIAGNKVVGCGDHGISLVTGTTACTIEGNESTANADPATRRANGIYLSGSPRNTIRGNFWHHNQDSGQQIQSSSDSVVSIQNVSWANGDHGFDHLYTIGVVHVGDVAYGNALDGFSFEGGSTGCSVHDCIAVENGLATNEADLWVEEASMSGFDSDDNIFWNSTSQPPIKRGLARYADVSAWSATSGLDTRSTWADPLFVDPANGDFRLHEGSPAIDDANSSVPYWPATDAAGNPRVDDPQSPDRGVGAVSYADRGAFEYQVDSVSTASAPPTDPQRAAALRVLPNPARVHAEIRFATHGSGPLSIGVYDLGGRCVRTLRAGGQAAGGDQRFALDLRGDDGRRLKAGIYFIRVQCADGPLSSRLLLLR